MKKKSQKRRKTPLKKSSAFRFSKPVFLLFSLVLSAVILFAGTYAWQTSADKKTNKFDGTYLSAKITEVFSSNMIWEPGTETEKVVRVENNGEAAAFVRLSLTEYLLTFQVDTTDQTGNGNLIQTDQPIEPTAELSKVDTWQKASEAGGTFAYQLNAETGSQYFIANQYVQNGPYPWEHSEDRPEPLPYAQIRFGNVYSSVQDTQTPYWLYYQGYFYYSKIVYAGGLTEPLMTGVALSNSLPNAYKGSLYSIDLQMDAIDIMAESLESWGMDKQSPVYDMLKEQFVE